MPEKKEEKNLLRSLVEGPPEEKKESEHRESEKELQKPRSNQTKTSVKKGREEGLSGKEIKEIDIEKLRKELGGKRSGISRSFYLDTSVWIKLNELSETLGVSTSRIVNRSLEKFFQELQLRKGEGEKQ